MASAFPSLTQVLQSPSDASAPKPREAKRGLLGRFLDALVESRQRDAEQHMTRLLMRSGGKLTDSLEREAERCSALGR